MEWQPIETAPRDGSKFLVTDFNRYSDAKWPNSHIIGRWEPMVNHKNEFYYGGGPLDFDQTHWSELPIIPMTRSIPTDNTEKQ